MKRIALMSIVAAAAAMFGLIKPTSAETTVPMEDLALVSEIAAPLAEPPVTGLEPVQYPRYQHPRQQYPRVQYPRQQYPRQQYPRQQYPRQQHPRQQYPRSHY
jgi:hypothetical protein